MLSRAIWGDRTGKSWRCGEGRALRVVLQGRVWPWDKDEDWQRVKITSLCFIRWAVVFKSFDIQQVLWLSGGKFRRAS